MEDRTNLDEMCQTYLPNLSDLQIVTHTVGYKDSCEICLENLSFTNILKIFGLSYAHGMYSFLRDNVFILVILAFAYRGFPVTFIVTSY